MDDGEYLLVLDEDGAISPPAQGSKVPLLGEDL